MWYQEDGEAPLGSVQNPMIRRAIQLSQGRNPEGPCSWTIGRAGFPQVTRHTGQRVLMLDPLTTAPLGKEVLCQKASLSCQRSCGLVPQFCKTLLQKENEQPKKSMEQWLRRGKFIFYDLDLFKNRNQFRKNGSNLNR